ncbi:MAG TPA: acyclic terpene utilization AtuA family protein [Ktedonobacteraceae bacterium]
MDEIRYIAGTLVGAGVDSAALNEALKDDPHFIACDAGTTDAGPFSLGSGQPAFAREAVKRDLATFLDAGRRAGIPVLIGSAGTAGADAQVDWTLDIVNEIVREAGVTLRTAVIYAEQDTDSLIEKFRQERIKPLEAAPHLDEDTIKGSAHIVGMMGAEPLQKALAEGVDFILAGRCSDSALYAALPILHGFPEGLAWHAGKVVECGTMACETAGKGIMFVRLRHDHFLVKPFGRGLRCTPQSVAAHSLYENVDPFHFTECSGTVDITEATYEAVDPITVRVANSHFQSADPYTVKLEGAELLGYQTVIIGGIRDPFLLRQLDSWLANVRTYIEESIARVLDNQVTKEDYHLVFHVYGRDGVMGALEPEREVIPKEVGIVLEATAATQQFATVIAQLSRQPLLHYPIAEWHGATTTFAYLHNPAYIERGAVYRFNLHHVVIPQSPLELFRTKCIEIGRTELVDVNQGGVR